MNGFYQFTTKIKDSLKLDPFVKTVTYGDIFQVDLNKQTIFPLSHLVVNNVTKESNVMRFNVSILAMDIVDVSKEPTTDIFIGNDNTHDIWNTQLKVLDRLTELLRRGSIVSDGYQLDGNPTFEQFTERFENYLAGWTVTFDVIVANDMTICEVGSSGSSCDDASYVITDSEGNILYNGNIASGATETQVIEDSRAVLKDTLGATISTTSILAEASEDITAPNSTYLVEYVNGTDIQSGSIVSGGSVTVQVPNPVTCEDATVNVNGAFWDSVPSGGTENVIVRQSSGSTQVGSIQGQYFRIADSTAVLKTTGGTTISTTSIKAEASANIVAPNTTIEVNGTTEGTVVAGATVDIQLSNPSGTVTPTSVTQVGNDLQVVLPASVAPVGAKVLKTGQTVSNATYDDGDLERGRLASFLTLASNNPFGNTNRFTDKLGGQTYANSVAYDWSTFDGTSVSAYYYGDANTRTWATQLSQYATSTIDGLNGWFLFNIHEAMSLMNFSYPSTFLYGYAPFSLTRRYMFVSTNVTGLLGLATDTGPGSPPFTSVNKTNALWGIWTRVCTVSGTTIT